MKFLDYQLPNDEQLTGDEYLDNDLKHFDLRLEKEILDIENNCKRLDHSFMTVGLTT